MRRIIFNDVTINEIRNFIKEGHTKKETCNRFTIKLDTLTRIMKQNNIEPYYKNKNHYSNKFTENNINIICNLFKNTEMRMQDIVKESKLSYYEVLEIIKSNFTEEEINNRHSKLYRNSKTGNKNPMKEKKGILHHNYKGDIEDGNGYLMRLKPEWYTGRKGSNHVFSHSLIMCENIGISEIPEGFVVHHIDGNKKNNDISNLALMTISAHSKLHHLQIKMCKVQRLSDNGVGRDSEKPNNNCNIS